MATTNTVKRRVGIVGAGLLGQYLIEQISKDATASAAFEIAFVWNRTLSKLVDNPLIAECARCENLADFPSFNADVIVEVCHPSVAAEWGERFLEHADFYCGSPTAFADPDVASSLRAASASSASGRGLYIPAGALWGSTDLGKMADRGSLKFLSITMKKHPLSLKLGGELGAKLDSLIASGVAGESILYTGPVRQLCSLAPNNVNTMAVAAIAAGNLGFDGVAGTLISDPALQAHVITIDARGAVTVDGQQFRVFTERYNPSPPGAVTGLATYGAFLSSLFNARGRGAGLHLC